jgi:hypothetical protein
MNGEITDLQAYEHIRVFDRSSLACLPQSSYFHLLKNATELRHGPLIGQLIEDLLELRPDSERCSTVLAIVSSPSLPLASPNAILVILECLHSSPDASQLLTRDRVATLVNTIADTLPNSSDERLVELIFPLLLAQLEALPIPTGPDVLTYFPPYIIRASFAFVDKLLKLSQEERALNIFQILVNSGNIPSEAVQTIPGLTDFASIVRSSLVRACTHWHWRPLAERFLSPLLNTTPSPSSSTISLAIDTIYGCLGAPTPADLAACRALISQMHPISPVPNGIVRQFYTIAEEMDADREARELYAFTRSKEALTAHRYPSPRGSSLPWLLRSLLSANSYLAQELATEIFEGNLPIALEHRSHIVEGLASRGHGTLARALWSRFAVGKDRDPFIGDASLMIRMVSLFSHLAKKQDDLLASRADQGELPGDGRIRNRSEDYKSFLNFVYSEFCRAHSPLWKAHHQILTSQARALFIMGEYLQGFETLKMLLERKEMPDLYDVNVTLTAMAPYNPRMADQIVDRMIEKGLQPDQVTFGTVMHHALLHGDMKLAEKMINRVRGLKNSHLSYKSIVSLMRGSLGSAPDFNQRAKLLSVFEIIKSIGHSTVVATPHVGRYLVYAALRADDPVMAYAFWEYLLKDNAAPDDREQVFQRRLIASLIRKHQKHNWVKDDHARVMLSQLKAKD